VFEEQESAMDSTLKHFYHLTQFQIEDEDTSNSEKAENMRRMLFFLEKMVKLNKLNNEGCEVLREECNEQYRCLVDNMDREIGLDNYSEIIPMLRERKENRSEQWKSGLSFDDVDGGKAPFVVRNMLENITRETGRKMKIMCSTWEKCTNTASMQENRTIKNDENSKIEYHNPVLPRQSTITPQIPSFGKRKQTFHNDDVRKSEKKSQINNFLYKNIADQETKKKDNLSKVEQNGDGHFTKTMEEEETIQRNPFLTAGQQLHIDSKKTNRGGSNFSYGQGKKSLGAKAHGVSGKFIPPIGQEPKNDNKKQTYDDDNSKTCTESKYEEFEWMKNVDPKMIEHVENEIMDNGEKITWDDIAGLEFAKSTIQEIVIWPMLRPDLFTGLRGPPKGLLLFGPPGTGKTLIGKCIASQSNAKFFNISASSLTSKWIGDGEKMVRALFGVARCVQPSVIFIDEIDSLLTQRSDSEHESSRRLKTEFLVQLDGATALLEDRILVVGATNRPQELDEAARRRLVKRLYIPLPDASARQHIINNLMKEQLNDLDECNIEEIVEKSQGFSGADMANLCRDAALGPIRGIMNIKDITVSEVRPVNRNDFVNALTHVRPSVSQNDLQVYVDWNCTYGSGG